MDFPIFHLDLIGNRMLIALIATIHVFINHAFAVGFIPIVTLLEYLGYRERMSNPGLGKQWDELARKVMCVGFITTTSLGALTGVGIWFSVSLVNPAAIGSLIRVFYSAWFSEWIVFVFEVIFIMAYFLWWKRSNNSYIAKKRHIISGAALSVFSWLTLAIITGILGFMMNPGSWNSMRTFFSGFANPIYIPQLYFRTPLTMMMGGALVLFLIPFILKKGIEIREKAISFVSMWLLIWAPALFAGALLYRAAIPGNMAGNFPTALATMAFVKWYNSLLVVISGIVAVTILIALWGFLKPRKMWKFALLIPIFTLFILVGSFERVREFIRKPFVIGDYMYANGLRAADYPLYKKNGALPYAVYVSTPRVTEQNKLEAGKNVFMIACSRCHTVNGINSVVVKFRKLTPPGEPLNPAAIKQFISMMDKVRYFMPPFPGNEAELDALTAFIIEMDKNPKPIDGAQTEGVKINSEGI
jgi:hypothetical protein